MKVYYSDEDSLARWQAHIAPQCQLLLCVEAPTDQEKPVLWLDHQGLWLLNRAGHRIRLEAEDIQSRLKGSNPLAQACGQNYGLNLKILDPMAGWGLDALVLHALGATITLAEQQPEIGLLLHSMLLRLSFLDIRLYQNDGWQCLQVNNAYDVVYLDPMFPSRNKGALPKQRLQLLSELGCEDTRPLEEWLRAARTAATNRVVIKRRSKDSVSGSPDWQVRARSIRFDVYRAG